MTKSEQATVPGQLLNSGSIAQHMLDQEREFGLTTHTDIQVSTGDIVEIVTTKFEKQVKQQLRAAEQRVAVAEQAVADATKALKDHCEEDAKNYGEDKAELFKAAYASIGLGFNYETAVTIGDKGYTIKHVVYASKSTGYGNSRNNEATWVTEVTFRKSGCVRLCTAISKAEQERDDLKKLQLDWRRKLTEIPDVERRARASLAEKALGQSEGGQQLMTAITRAFNDEFGDLPTFEPIALLK